MKITTIVIRTLVGLLMLFASINYFLHLTPEPAFTGKMKVFSDGIAASGYLMPLAKIVELLCGLSFVTGKFTKLFGIVLLPLTVNIFLINVNLMPDGVVIAGALLFGNLFVIYTNWGSYNSMLKA
jgi:putative oxidoreductase